MSSLNAMFLLDVRAHGGQYEERPHRRPCLAFHAGIGTLLAAWLVAQPNVQPVLLGRSGCFSSTVPDLLLADTPVTALRCDAAVAAEAAAACAASAAGQVSAILHAGGVLQDGVLRQQTAASVRAVCGPKLGFLDQAVAAPQLQPLQAVNLLSSVSAFVGSPGQANYAAANAALDCWAAALQQHGMPGSSVQWGAWAGVGMAHGNAAVLTRVERSGMGLVQPVRGLEALLAVLGSSATQPMPQVRSCAAIASRLCMGNRAFACTHDTTLCPMLHLLPQTIASPFQFDRLLHNLDPVPYIFSHVAAPPEDAQKEAAQPDIPPAVSAVMARGPSAAEVAERVRSRVQALLGPEVSQSGPR